jgi:hypothetical protein
MLRFHLVVKAIIDHLAILQPSVRPASPQPWADLPKVLELAKRAAGSTSPRLRGARAGEGLPPRVSAREKEHRGGLPIRPGRDPL